MKKKLLLSATAAIVMLTTNASAGQLLGNIYGGGGNMAFKPTIGDSYSNTEYQLGFGSKYAWSTGITFGADFGLDYSETKNGYQNETTPFYGFDGMFKLGYSIGGDSGKGLGVYATYDFLYGVHETKTVSTYGGTTTVETSSDSKACMGPGVQVEYVFDNGFGLSALYQTYSGVTDKNGYTYGDMNSLIFRVSYQWNNK